MLIQVADVFGACPCCFESYSMDTDHDGATMYYSKPTRAPQVTDAGDKIIASRAFGYQLDASHSSKALVKMQEMLATFADSQKPAAAA